MKIAYIDLCGFRGYRNRLRLDFAEDFTIIDGRNGVGKSTIFDAVEYALTGQLSKYKDAKADGETAADYVWWTGKGPQPKDRYVEVGFAEAQQVFRVRRGEFDSPDQTQLDELTSRLCDVALAPGRPIGQVCTSTVIRDEHIAGLSLDLKETERYALLRDGLGANDAEKWISRGAKLAADAKKRTQAAQHDIEQHNAHLMSSTRRLDDIRARLTGDDVLAAAIVRLRAFAKSEAAPDELAGPVREAIAKVSSDIQALRDWFEQASTVGRAQASLPGLMQARDGAAAEQTAAAQALELLQGQSRPQSSSQFAEQARNLVALVGLGHKLGLHNGQCPLCRSPQEQVQFEQGLIAAEELARALDQRAAEEQLHEQHLAAASARLAQSRQAVSSAETALAAASNVVQQFEAFCAARGWSTTAAPSEMHAAANELSERLSEAQRDLRVLETVRLNSELEKAKRDEAQARERLTSAQERAGRARKAEAIANALHDATRRAAGETLDRRLDRVLPLMSELYRRLRPHPIWRDIEYSVRGDVRKFLKLQVGDELNPQFLFSSGQRRATGLAFLLSVNLSLAWSRWRTIMLDDPVQHVDDFRTVHLAELAAQLVVEGRQIICAVEDAALAELFCRRLPVRTASSAKRATLGPDENGDLGIISESHLPMLPRNALLGNKVMAASG